MRRRLLPPLLLLLLGLLLLLPLEIEGNRQDKHETKETRKSRLSYMVVTNIKSKILQGVSLILEAPGPEPWSLALASNIRSP